MQDMGEMIVEMWLSLKPYIDKKERPEAAVAFLRSCEDFVDLESVKEAAIDADSALLAAFTELLGEDPEEDSDYDKEYQ